MIRHTFCVLAVTAILGQMAVPAGTARAASSPDQTAPAAGAYGTPGTLAVGPAASGAALPAGVPPYNDECHSAIAIPALPHTATQLTTDATIGEFDPALPCGSPTLPRGSHSVWFAWTPEANGKYEANTFGSSYDTVLAVMTGPCAAYGQIACSDDAGGAQSQVFWDADAGVTYYIEVASYGASAGGTLNLSVLGVPPSNDGCGNPWPLVSQDGTHSQTIAFATTGKDEPVPPCAAINRTVWFAFTAQQDGVVLLNTGGSDFDTVMAVYRGACGGPWRLEACNDDPASTLTGATWSELAVDVAAGQQYFLQVGSYAPSGPTHLWLRYTFGPPPISIAEARCLPLETRLTIADVVLNGYFLGFPNAQQQDRAAAMHLSIAHNGPQAPGSIVTVTGALSEYSGNLYLHDGAYVYTGAAPVTPLLMTTGTVGGYRSCRQAGRPGGYGPNNISLLVEVCGRVTGVDAVSQIYWVDDGCGLRTDEPYQGLRVWSQHDPLPAEGSYVRVIGMPWIWEPSYSPLLREVFPPEYVLGGPGPAPPLAAPAAAQAGGDPSVGM